MREAIWIVPRVGVASAPDRPAHRPPHLHSTSPGPLAASVTVPYRRAWAPNDAVERQKSVMALYP